MELAEVGYEYAELIKLAQGSNSRLYFNMVLKCTAHKI